MDRVNRDEVDARRQLELGQDSFEDAAEDGGDDETAPPGDAAFGAGLMEEED